LPSAGIRITVHAPGVAVSVSVATSVDPSQDSETRSRRRGSTPHDLVAGRQSEPVDLPGFGGAPEGVPGHFAAVGGQLQVLIEVRPGRQARVGAAIGRDQHRPPDAVPVEDAAVAQVGLQDHDGGRHRCRVTGGVQGGA
jgi:hypothetical protein